MNRKKNLFSIMIIFIFIITTACSKKDKNSQQKKYDTFYNDVAVSYFSSDKFKNNFEVKSSGIDIREVVYKSEDNKEIKGWQGKIDVKSKNKVTEKQILEVAEASLMKYMDNGSSNVVRYECVVYDKNNKKTDNVFVGYADYKRSRIVQLSSDKEDAKCIKIQTSLIKENNENINGIRYFFDCNEDIRESVKDKENKKIITGDWYLATAVVLENKDNDKLRKYLVSDEKEYLEEFTDKENDNFKGIIAKVYVNGKIKEKIAVCSDGKVIYF